MLFENVSFKSTKVWGQMIVIANGLLNRFVNVTFEDTSLGPIKL